MAVVIRRIVGGVREIISEAASRAGRLIRRGGREAEEAEDFVWGMGGEGEELPRAPTRPRKTEKVGIIPPTPRPSQAKPTAPAVTVPEGERIGTVEPGGTPKAPIVETPQPTATPPTYTPPRVTVTSPELKPPTVISPPAPRVGGKASFESPVPLTTSSRMEKAAVEGAGTTSGAVGTASGTGSVFGRVEFKFPGSETQGAAVKSSEFSVPRLVVEGYYEEGRRVMPRLAVAAEPLMYDIAKFGKKLSSDARLVATQLEAIFAPFAKISTKATKEDLENLFTLFATETRDVVRRAWSSAKMAPASLAASIVGVGIPGTLRRLIRMAKKGELEKVLKELDEAERFVMSNKELFKSPAEVIEGIRKLKEMIKEGRIRELAKFLKRYEANLVTLMRNATPRIRFAFLRRLATTRGGLALLTQPVAAFLVYPTIMATVMHMLGVPGNYLPERLMALARGDIRGLLPGFATMEINEEAEEKRAFEDRTRRLVDAVAPGLAKKWTSEIINATANRETIRRYVERNYREFMNYVGNMEKLCKSLSTALASIGSSVSGPCNRLAALKSRFQALYSELMHVLETADSPEDLDRIRELLSKLDETLAEVGEAILDVVSGAKKSLVDYVRSVYNNPMFREIYTAVSGSNELPPLKSPEEAFQLVVSTLLAYLERYASSRSLSEIYGEYGKLFIRGTTEEFKRLGAKYLENAAIEKAQADAYLAYALDVLRTIAGLSRTMIMVMNGLYPFLAEAAKSESMCRSDFCRSEIRKLYDIARFARNIVGAFVTNVDNPEQLRRFIDYAVSVARNEMYRVADELTRSAYSGMVYTIVLSYLLNAMEKELKNAKSDEERSSIVEKYMRLIRTIREDLETRERRAEEAKTQFAKEMGIVYPLVYSIGAFLTLTLGGIFGGRSTVGLLDVLSMIADEYTWYLSRANKDTATATVFTLVSSYLPGTEGVSEDFAKNAFGLSARSVSTLVEDESKVEIDATEMPPRTDIAPGATFTPLLVVSKDGKRSVTTVTINTRQVIDDGGVPTYVHGFGGVFLDAVARVRELLQPFDPEYEQAKQVEAATGRFPGNYEFDILRAAAGLLRADGIDFKDVTGVEVLWGGNDVAIVVRYVDDQGQQHELVYDPLYIEMLRRKMEKEGGNREVVWVPPLLPPGVEVTMP